MNETEMGKSKLSNKKYKIGILLNLAFIVVEFVFGGIASSMALITDAVHNLADVLSLVISLIAIYLMKKKPTKRHTYGFYNTTIMSALVNSIILFVSLAAVIWESLIRLTTQSGSNQPVGWLVAVVALSGVLINGLTALLMNDSRELNDRSNFWHFLGDTLLSVAVFVAGLIISFTSWNWLDPVISIAAACFILYESWNVLKEAFEMSTNAVPRRFESDEIERYLLAVPEVKAINDLHIWALSTTETALTAHIEIEEQADYFKTQELITKGIEDKFQIGHVTVQLETYDKEHCEVKI